MHYGPSTGRVVAAHERLFDRATSEDATRSALDALTIKGYLQKDRRRLPGTNARAFYRLTDRGYVFLFQVLNLKFYPWRVSDWRGHGYRELAAWASKE